MKLRRMQILNTYRCPICNKVSGSEDWSEKTKALSGGNYNIQKSGANACAWYCPCCSHISEYFSIIDYTTENIRDSFEF